MRDGRTIPPWDEPVRVKLRANVKPNFRHYEGWWPTIVSERFRELAFEMDPKCELAFIPIDVGRPDGTFDRRHLMLDAPRQDVLVRRPASGFMASDGPRGLRMDPELKNDGFLWLDEDLVADRHIICVAWAGLTFSREFLNGLGVDAMSKRKRLLPVGVCGRDQA